MIMKQSWTKWLLLIAAGWNVFGGTSALLDPAQHFAQMYTSSLSLDDPLQLFFYRGVWINVIAWGIAYFVAAMLPTARIAVLVAGAVGKSAYFFSCLLFFTSGVGQTLVWVTGGVDLIFAALFATAIFRARTFGAPSNSSGTSAFHA